MPCTERVCAHHRSVSLSVKISHTIISAEVYNAKERDPFAAQGSLYCTQNIARLSLLHSEHKTFQNSHTTQSHTSLHTIATSTNTMLQIPRHMAGTRYAGIPRHTYHAIHGIPRHMACFRKDLSRCFALYNPFHPHVSLVLCVPCVPCPRPFACTTPLVMSRFSSHLQGGHAFALCICTLRTPSLRPFCALPAPSLRPPCALVSSLGAPLAVCIHLRGTCREALSLLTHVIT